MSSPILAAARQYHDLGFNVIPTAQDKRPAADPMGAGRLSWDRWQTERQTPEDFALLPWAVATGAAAVCGPVSGDLVCMDFDGGTEPAPVRAVLATLGLPADYPWTVQTPSGAYHVWVSCPGLALDGNKGKLDRPGRLGFAHIELRWTGHYAILPPSNTGAYAFLGGEHPTEGPAVVTPAALLAAFALVTEEKKPPARVETAPVIDAARVAAPVTDRYAQAALRGELAKLATAHEGTRNEQLNRSAFALGSLVATGALDRADVEGNLTDVALALGLGEAETRATIKSGLEDGAKEPRVLPAPAYRNGSRPTGELIDAEDPGTIADDPSAAPRARAAAALARAQTLVDVRPIWGAVEDLARLSPGELAKFKDDAKGAFGKALNLNDLTAAVRQAQRDARTRARGAGDLPCVVVTDRPLRDVTTDAMQALTLADRDGPTLFVRAGALVRIRADEKGRPIIDNVTEAVLTSHLARAADWARVGEHGHRHIKPPEAVVTDLLALGRWPFPPLEAVVEVPTLRPDGSILTMPGYDPQTALYYAPAPGLNVPAIPEDPTRADVVQALELIDEAIGDFPYVGAASRAAAFALLLTPIVRPALNGAVPLALVDAPAQGTGKSLLADVAGILATGRRAPMMGAPDNGEEWRKQITASLYGGASFILIDNVEGTLHAPDLARALTAATWEDRILGRTEKVFLPNRATWAATGNNIRLAGDLPRRCYRVRLDAQTARPWQRDKAQFKHPDLAEWVTITRGRLIAALLTLARAWFVAARPQPEGLVELGSFEAWCNMLGGILAHAGVTGFLANLEELYNEADDEGPAWEAFLTAWYAALGEKALTVAELTEYIRSNDDLRAAVPAYLAEYLPRDETDAQGKVKPADAGKFKYRLGNALKKKRDAYYGPYCLKTGEKDRTKAQTWKITQSARGDAETRGDSSLGGWQNTHLYLESKGGGVIGGDGGEVSPRVSLSPRAPTGEPWEEGEL